MMIFYTFFFFPRSMNTTDFVSSVTCYLSWQLPQQLLDALTLHLVQIYTFTTIWNAINEVISDFSGFLFINPSAHPHYRSTASHQDIKYAVMEISSAHCRKMPVWRSDTAVHALFEWCQLANVSTKTINEDDEHDKHYSCWQHHVNIVIVSILACWC